MHDVQPGTIWQHRRGGFYAVVCLTNEANEERYPATVVYQDGQGRLWSRRLDDWHRSMTMVERRGQTVFGGHIRHDRDADFALMSVKLDSVVIEGALHRMRSETNALNILYAEAEHEASQ